MPAKTKAELEVVAAKEFAKLERVLAEVPGPLTLAKDTDDTSVRDIVAHRAHWIDLFLGWYADGQAGRKVHFPAPGYKWSDLKRYNAALRQEHANLNWVDTRHRLSDRHAALAAFIAARTDAELYGGPMKGAQNDWTTGRWAEAAGPSHYRSAARYIRARLKAAS